MRGFVILAVTCWGASAAADDSRFYPPEGCTGFLTVQSRSCEVSHYWTCEGDAEGDQWSVDLGLDGPMHLSQIDYETQWLDSYDFSPPERSQIVFPAKNPASFTALLRDGRDTYDFQMRHPSGLRRVVGEDRILDYDVEIDGEPLMRTGYMIRVTAEDGALIWEAKGHEYISAQHRRFFSGRADGRTPNDDFAYDNSPVKFIYPGEPGYFSETPLYGCHAFTVRYSPDKAGADR